MKQIMFQVKIFIPLLIYILLCKFITEDDIAIVPEGEPSSSDNSSLKQDKSIQSKEISLDRFLIKTNKLQKKQLDLQVARYIYATNALFRAVEHEQFIKLVEMLCPGYKLPS